MIEILIKVYLIIATLVAMWLFDKDKTIEDIGAGFTPPLWADISSSILAGILFPLLILLMIYHLIEWGWEEYNYRLKIKKIPEILFYCFCLFVF